MMDSAAGKPFVAALTICLTLATVATVAAARDTERVRSVVEIEAINAAGDTVLGEVRSRGARSCKRQRTVTLRHGAPGAGGELVGTDRTDRRGNWRINDPEGLPPGEYHARVRRRVIERPGATIVCSPDVDRFG